MLCDAKTQGSVRQSGQRLDAASGFGVVTVMRKYSPLSDGSDLLMFSHVSSSVKDVRSSEEI